ncbi:pyridoxal 5'-phosphate synthase glutaminase subunit PdxT [Anaerolineales bacterium HSG24]|nr:pyridoxal 5'-phosphate synthase glutaminase subunit PdxT [Anaerolineales bacterium HSG24]
MNQSPNNLIFKSYSADPKGVSGVTIGILALQGAFLEHANMLRRFGATPMEVRLPDDLTGLDGLIIPGGESTTIGKLAIQFGLVEPIQQFIQANKPVWGTCAGMIFLAQEVGATGSGGHVIPPRLGSMDITVNRNAFGRQVDSFEVDLELSFATGQPFRAVFIRAPRIEANGQAVEILARLSDGTPVAVRQNNLLATAFHPELTDDDRLHDYFLTMVKSFSMVKTSTNAIQEGYHEAN